MFEYMKGNRMKWPAVVYKTGMRDYIKHYLNISGIPDLAIFDGDGHFITLGGRSDVARLGAKAFEKWDRVAKLKAARRASTK
jgi:hypothetical protein